jgi:DNA-directed RNA polymerase subunit RPC12/RpoP
VRTSIILAVIGIITVAQTQLIGLKDKNQVIRTNNGVNEMDKMSNDKLLGLIKQELLYKLKTTVVKCPKCGEENEFDIENDTIICDQCDSVLLISDCDNDDGYSACII